MTVKTVGLKTPNNWDVKILCLQMLLLNRFHDTFFVSLTIHPFYPQLELNTAKHSLYYTDMQTDMLKYQPSEVLKYALNLYTKKNKKKNRWQ